MPLNAPKTRASLILRLQDAADVVAWEEFVQVYSPVVYRVAITRGFQTADAENIVQEVLLAVAKSMTGWLERTDRGSFRAWLLRIARNEAYDLINSRSTRPLGADGPEAERMLAELPDVSEVSSNLDLEYERSVFRWAADQVRDSVAEHTWRAFWLTQIEERSIQETSGMLGVREGAVYVARSRVMTRIKMLVTQYEEPE